MRKKLFTLMTLLLCAVTGANAAAYTPTSTDGDVVMLTKTNIEANDYLSVSTDNWTTGKGYGSSLDVSSGDYYNMSKTDRFITFTVSGASKIDVGVYNTNSGRNYTVKVGNGEAQSFSPIGGLAWSGDINLGTTGEVTIIIASDGTGSVYPTAIKVYKAGSTKTITSKELTGININGDAWNISGLSSYAATISTAYTAVPEVEFIYTVKYDDNTSDEGLSENVIATKDSETGYYVAASSELTNKVTLTFTNVSISKQDANLSYTTSTLTKKIPGTTFTNTLTNPNSVTGITYSITSNGTGSTIDASTGEVTVGSTTGTETVTATFAGDDLYNAGNATYTMVIGEATAQTSVSEETTWTWDNITPKDQIEYANKPSSIILVDEDRLNFSNFGGAASAIKLTDVQRPMMKGSSNRYCAQAGGFTLEVTTAGEITIEMSGNNNNSREVRVNGSKVIEYNNTTINTINKNVESGTVTVAFYQEEDATLARIYSIKFTPAAADVDVTGVTVDETASVEVGATKALTATVLPENATNQNVTWASDAEDIATVDEDGVVTGVAAGTATITVTTTDGGKTATCTVTVTEAATPATTTGGDVDFDYSASGASASEWTQSPITVSSNATQIDNSNKFIKSWSGEDLTVTVAGTDALVTKVVLTYQGTNRLPSEITANDKTEVTTSEATQTWENANGVASVTFTLAGSPRLTKVSVEYASKVATLNGDGYATFSYADDVQIFGVKAYSASLDINAKQITCTQAAGNKVPAGTGVLLYGTAEAGVYAKTTTGVDALASNDLKATTKADGTLVTLDNTKYFYVLSGSSFVKYTGTAFVADKAYFESDIDLASSSARGFSIVFEDNDATGIKAIEKAQQNGGEYYNLAGQRVAQPKKGLYIVNGKKVIIK